MKVLIGCEESAKVRDAFRRLGHDAWSVDLVETRGDRTWHLVDDLFAVVAWESWDMLIAFPPCTHVCVSGAGSWYRKGPQQRAALQFMKAIMELSVPKIAMENPIGKFSTWGRKPDQIVQPHWFGDPAFKATCLWLKGLAPLTATNPLKIPLKGTPEWTAWNKIHRMAPGPNRARDRSETFQGIADAMAEQWGGAIA